MNCIQWCTVAVKRFESLCAGKGQVFISKVRAQRKRKRLMLLRACYLCQLSRSPLPTSLLMTSFTFTPLGWVNEGRRQYRGCAWKASNDQGCHSQLMSTLTGWYVVGKKPSTIKLSNNLRLILPSSLEGTYTWVWGWQYRRICSADPSLVSYLSLSCPKSTTIY